MAADFKILTHLNSSYLHLKLEGNFDHASADQLIDLLRRYCHKVSTIIIHTDCLTRDVSSGQNQFKNHLGLLRKEPVRFIFTGENASLFS